MRPHELEHERLVWYVRRTPTEAAADRARGEKWCPVCRQALPLESFNRNNRPPTGRQGKCRECEAIKHAAWRARNPDQGRVNALKLYGMTLADYDARLADQGGVCAICGKPETWRHRKGTACSLSVDHCHESGVIGGLLCQKCNAAIGMLDDNPELAQAAAAYLCRTRPHLKVA